jgi:Pyruvate/2-oxoacid:ferredoxin oxidoreductase delta subunit
MDIPEFYALVEELFTPEEALVASSMPRRPSTVDTIAQQMGKDPKEIETVLEAMADKGLCSSFPGPEGRLYVGLPFVPGIFEFQFMKGTRTERDRRLAKLIHAYKEAVDARRGPPRITFPTERVIPVEKTIQPGARIHTYQQVSAYIERYDPIAVSTCFCRHEGKLVDEKSDCGKPDDVCMQFGNAAQFVIERGIGRRITKEQAMEVLRRAEEAGLVHATRNTQDIDYLCNCCPCHCMILKTALAQPKPGLALNSGFHPRFDSRSCVQCETCIERCPAGALTMGEDSPILDMDRCFGCAVCSTGCPQEAINMVERPHFVEPPPNTKALREAIKARSS